MRSEVCAVVALLCLIADGFAASPEPELVDIQSVDPTILVELRYGSARNITGKPIYPPGTRALVRPAVAQRLATTQTFLRSHHYGLKIWDAYRPPAAQQELWQLSRNRSYVAEPGSGLGSLHTWGVAVDATLVDERGREVEMPTDFDEFTSDAKLHYAGVDALVKWHLRVLQVGMRRGGFYGMRTEWWHFVAYGWKNYGPIKSAVSGAR